MSLNSKIGGRWVFGQSYSMADLARDPDIRLAVLESLREEAELQIEAAAQRGVDAEEKTERRRLAAKDRKPRAKTKVKPRASEKFDSVIDDDVPF